MRLDRLTSKFQVAISDAQSLALGRDHQYIEPVHIMNSLMNQEGSTVKALMEAAGVNFNSLRSLVAEAMDKLPKVSGIGKDVQLAKDTVILLNLCDKIAQKRKDDYISSEIFVLAATTEQASSVKFYEN